MDNLADTVWTINIDRDLFVSMGVDEPNPDGVYYGTTLMTIVNAMSAAGGYGWNIANHPVDDIIEMRLIGEERYHPIVDYLWDVYEKALNYIKEYVQLNDVEYNYINAKLYFPQNAIVVWFRL